MNQSYVFRPLHCYRPASNGNTCQPNARGDTKPGIRVAYVVLLVTPRWGSDLNNECRISKISTMSSYCKSKDFTCSHYDAQYLLLLQQAHLLFRLLILLFCKLRLLISHVSIRHCPRKMLELSTH